MKILIKYGKIILNSIRREDNLYCNSNEFIKRGERIMALWRKTNKASSKGKPRYVPKLIDKQPSLIQHGGFFISTEGQGVCIDYAERRQATKRRRPIRK